MKLAYYAPLKSPDHTNPSGDRTMARALITALERTGATVELASQLRSRDGVGSREAQEALFNEAQAQHPALIAQGQRAGWRAWVTYHNHYKAPDLLGPTVARALGIPYLLIEATRAKKRLSGPWAEFAKAAEAASDAAAVIFYLTNRDAQALRRDAPEGQRLIHLRPFLARDDLPPASAGMGPMLNVGMMRAGDKLASYRIIAQTLAQLPKGWKLNIAGDGPARAEVETLMEPFGDAVTFLGKLEVDPLADVYAGSALLFWPGVNEAFGFAYLEAQARGLPVVAQHRPGVCDVLAPASYPSEETGPEGLAQMLTHYLNAPDQRRLAGQAARQYVGDHHLLPAATETLRAGLASVGVNP